MVPTGIGCSVVGRVGPRFGRFSAGFLVLDGCSVGLSVTTKPLDDIVVVVGSILIVVTFRLVVVDSTWVVVPTSLSSSSLFSSELQ